MEHSVVDLAFPHSYDIEVRPSRSDYSDRMAFSGISDRGHLAGLEVGVIHRLKNRRWFGEFTLGTDIATALSGVFSHPDPEKVCVVSGGQVFVVTAADPREWEAIAAPFPVTQALSAVEAEMLIFADFTRVAGLKRTGIAWITPVANDGVQILGSNVRRVSGLAWSSAEDRMVKFSVDLETGERTGGAVNAT